MKEYTKLPGGELEVTIPIRLRYDGHKTVILSPRTRLRHSTPPR